MNTTLSPDAQAILLLAAPLIVGRAGSSPDYLTPGEYKRLARFLHDRQRRPADLLATGDRQLLAECEQVIDGDRLQRLLGRGFLLSQAIELWQTRAIWVVSRADADYPRRLRSRLKDEAPPVLYGCGDAAILAAGGLAVVGSRHVDEASIEYATGIGRLVAQANQVLVSGGARGIDQAAMRGAQEAGGNVAGVLADSLERTALSREHRNLLRDRRLVLVSPYDPSAGFSVGHAMQRNKLIYALADAALVVSSDYMKGGTWSGAIEQLEKLRLVPVYVRASGENGPGLDALRRKGASPWPNPETPEALAELLVVSAAPKKVAPDQIELFSSVREEPEQAYDAPAGLHSHQGVIATESVESRSTAAEELFAKVRELLKRMEAPKTDAEVAADLNVPRSLAKKWLQRLVEEGLLEKHAKPVRYGPKSQLSLLE